MVEKNTTESNLENFKKLVRKAIYLNKDEEIYFQAIPNEKWLSIFKKNFNGNYNYAQRVIMNKFKEIEAQDTERVDREKNKIHNLAKATKVVTKAIDDQIPILFITDFDNDGSLAQSIINEHLKIDREAAKTMHVEYAQTVNGNNNRGFTVDLVEKIVQYKEIDADSEFLVITADNGINSREEQMKIHKKFPNATIIVTDHHNPEPEMVIEENDKAIIFNPHYKPTEFYQKFNISGATTISVLMTSVLNSRLTPTQLESYKIQLENISKLCKVSNLLDYVDTDPADKPEKDYVITRFLQLQPLLNINNSISKIITGEIPAIAIQAIKEKIPNLNSDLIYEEAKNIHIQNNLAKVLLKIHRDHKDDEKLTDTDFNFIFVKELNNTENYKDYDIINPNHIEQLRPLIFGLTADDSKTAFLDALNEKMIAVFESIKVSEKNIAQILRDGEVITKTRLENSVIAYADKNILSIFNRKFLNKVYNDENPGFSLTLDSVDKHKVSGSFRSLYDISEILKDKTKLEKELNVKIETPGHEKAAGFIIKALNPASNPIDSTMIEYINAFINTSISKIKENEIKSKASYLLTDLEAIQLIDRINRTIRGNISNFDRITPLLKLTPDTVWTDSYTTEQYSMYDIKSSKKYGYITINTNFHGDTVIIPVELVRRIVESGYKDYLSLNYMDGGVFMAEKVLSDKEAYNVIDLRNKNTKTKEIAKVFEKDFKDKNIVHLTREQIKDNPFFKYHDYGNLNFDLFERMVIGIIDTNKVDILSVFDVEANGFGNSKLMNFGAMNYSINSDSGNKIAKNEFINNFFYTQRGEEYLLTSEQTKDLKEITSKDKEALPLNIQKQLLIKNGLSDDSNDNYQIYYLYESKEKTSKLKNKEKKLLPFLQVKNYIYNSDDTVTYNREIKANMLAYLVKDRDFKVPQEMTNLTGITQKILNKYGKLTHHVDNELYDFYKDKNVLFGAHNTPYDARVLRANTPKFYEKLRKSKIYDSALFSREQKLAYDYVKVANFKGVTGMPENIYFYNNNYSDFSLINFLKENKTGYFPDRTGQYLFEIDKGDYYLVDKVKHEKVKIQATQEELSEKVVSGSIPNTSVKFSVEKLSEQWMIHALLLSDEKFDIKHVDLNQPQYDFLKKHEEAIIFFQDNYHFDTSVENNLAAFFASYDFIAQTTEEEVVLAQFADEFLEKNKLIQQKFSDAWMYKKVLSIKDPVRVEVTNDLVELVNYQTNIPQDKIRVIFDEAIKFKEKHKVSHILQHEGHINGPWEGDTKGDVAFEDKLTLSMLAQRMYDSYSHNVNEAIGMFNSYAVRAKLAFDMADQLSEGLANDSYSFRQGLLYDRKATSSVVSNIQEKESNLKEKTEKQIVKFKLGNDVLPADTAVYAVTKKGIQISRQNIEDDNEKLSFILINQQLEYSKENIGDSQSQQMCEHILEANKEKCIEYKKDLSQRYQYIEYSRRDSQLKKLIDYLITNLVEQKTKTPRLKVNEIDEKGYNIAFEIFDSYVESAKDTKLKDVDPDFISSLRQVIVQCKADNVIKIDNLMNSDIDEHFRTYDEISDVSFLAGVDIKRKDPLKILFNKYPDLRIINEFIEKTQKDTLEKNIHRKMKY